MTDKQGVSQRKLLERAIESAKRRGRSEDEISKISAELTLPDIKPGSEFLLDVFMQLSSTRPLEQAGPRPIPVSEIKILSDLLDIGLQPWEVAAIRACDSVFLDEHYKAARRLNG